MLCRHLYDGPAETFFQLQAMSVGRVAGAFGLAGVVVGATVYYASTRRRSRPQGVAGGALQPGQTLVCPLANIEQLSENSRKLRFQLPNAHDVLGLPAVSHILAIDGMSMRPYTPITVDNLDPPGSFELVVKRYPRGKFSNFFHRLEVGDCVSFKGPVRTVAYRPNQYACLCLIAGGTGITPMYQLLRTVLHDPADQTEIRLLYANRSVQDILLKNEIDTLRQTFPDRLKVVYLVEEEEAVLAQLETDDVRPGRITVQAITQLFPGPDGNGCQASVQDMHSGQTKLIAKKMEEGASSEGEKDMSGRFAIFVCGPTGMLQYLCGSASRDNQARAAPLGPDGLLTQLGYADHQITVLGCIINTAEIQVAPAGKNSPTWTLQLLLILIEVFSGIISIGSWHHTPRHGIMSQFETHTVRTSCRAAHRNSTAPGSWKPA
eukprot:g47086.t1